MMLLLYIAFGVFAAVGTIVGVAAYMRRHHPKAWENFLDDFSETVTLGFLPGPMKALLAVGAVMYGGGWLIHTYAQGFKYTASSPMASGAELAAASMPAGPQQSPDEHAKAPAIAPMPQAHATSDGKGSNSANMPEMPKGAGAPPMPTGDGQSSPNADGQRPKTPVAEATPTPEQQEEARKKARDLATKDKARREIDEEEQQKLRAKTLALLATPKKVATSIVPIAAQSAMVLAATSKAAAASAGDAPTADGPPELLPPPYGQLGDRPEPYVLIEKTRGDQFHARLLGRRSSQFVLRRSNGDVFQISAASVAMINGVRPSQIPDGMR